MKMLLSGTVGLVFLAAAGVQDTDLAIKKDKASLKGAWKFESFETAEGKKDDIDGATLSFDADKIEYKKGDEIRKGTFTINPAGKPKEIDLKADDKEMLGIYKIVQETLTMCICMEPGQARPAKFAAKDTCVLVTLKRLKE
jgi:uncharacterized protein (TIGR03067 family)